MTGGDTRVRNPLVGAPGAWEEAVMTDFEVLGTELSVRCMCWLSVRQKPDREPVFNLVPGMGY